MKFLKNISLIYFIVLTGSISLFVICTWLQWIHLQRKFEVQQVSSITRLASSVNSLMDSQSTFIMSIEKIILINHSQDENKSIQSEFDAFLKSNQDIAFIGLYQPDGNVDLISSMLNINPVPNLKGKEETRDIYKTVLQSKEVLLGRTYEIGSDGNFIIPLYKTLRDIKGEPIKVITLGLKINNSSFFNNQLHFTPHNVISLIRDDGYRQFISSIDPNLNEYDSQPKTRSSQLQRTVVEDIIQRYPYNKDSSIPYLFYTDVAQIVVTRLDGYGLWINSRLLINDIRSAFLATFLIQLFLFVILQIIVLFVARTVATKKKIQLEELLYQTNHDELTKLPNRQYLQNNIHSWIDNSCKPFSMILIDIDHFKLVNDSYGHHSGDYILQEIALRLKTLHTADEELIHYTGDQFIILTVITDELELMRLSSRIITKIALQYQIREKAMLLSCSIGIAKYPDHGDALTTLLRSADIAMCNAKLTCNTAHIFSTNMQKNYMRQLEIEQRLRVATDKESFYMVYQPQLDNQENIYGVEALVRWQDDKLGFVAPDEFISIAEDCGLMPKIGQYIIDLTLSEISTLQIQLDLSFQIAINISAQQFYQKDFYDALMSSIKRYKVDPRKVTIEITESLFIKNLEGVLPVLNRLRRHGISVSLDDFGTGYSSLSMLRTLPIDELKIDKSFTDDILIDIQSLKMVQNIVIIGKNLELSLVVEGVENVQQKQSLQECGCDYFQGYYYAKPMLLADLYKYLYEKNSIRSNGFFQSAR